MHLPTHEMLSCTAGVPRALPGVPRALPGFPRALPGVPRALPGVPHTLHGDFHVHCLVFHVHCLVFHVHCLVLLTVNYYTCRTDNALIAKTVISTRKLRSQCLTLQELHCLFFHYLIHRNFGTTFFCFFKLPHTL